MWHNNCNQRWEFESASANSRLERYKSANNLLR